jgi:hypothetical protein
MDLKMRNLAILSDANIITIQVVFPDYETSLKEYTYLCSKEWNLKVGDKVWTPKPNNQNTYGIAQIVEVSEEADIDVSNSIRYRFCGSICRQEDVIQEDELAEQEKLIRRDYNKTMRKQLRQQLVREITSQVEGEVSE